MRRWLLPLVVVAAVMPLLATERFEVVAKASGIANAPSAGRDVLSSMMRTLLADRFHLQIRRETRELPIFNLVLDKADGRLEPRLRTEDGQCVSISAASGGAADLSRWCGFRRVTRGAISERGMTLDEFASGISTHADVQRVVRNRTGLSGKYDFDVEYTPDSTTDPQAAPSFGTGLATALREQLGLRLDSTKGPVDVLVINHVERPTPD